MRLFARALVGAVALAVVSTGTAYADPVGSPPVTGDDAITMMAGGMAQPDVLANDSDPDGEPLAVCRLGNVSSSLEAEIDEGHLLVFASEPGTYTLTYYACDYQYLTPATVTVTVKPRPRLSLRVVKSDSHPGQLKIVNKGAIGFRFEWGSYRRSRADGHVYLAAHTRAWIHVRRVSIIWVASNARRGAFRVGITRGIRLPKGVHALPPGAPPAGTPIASASRWVASRR